MIIDFIKTLMPALEANQFFQGGLVLGAFTAVLVYLKPIPGRIWSRIERYGIFSVTTEYRESQRLYKFIERWLQKNHNSSYRHLKARLYVNEDSIDNPVWDSIEEPDKSLIPSEGIPTYCLEEADMVTEGTEEGAKKNEKSELSLEQINDWFYIWKFKRFIRISQNRDKLENSSNLSTLYNEHYVFSGWFAKKAINKLLNLIIAEGEAEERLKEKTTTEIYSTTTHGDTIFMSNIDVKDISKIIIEDKKNLIDDVIGFHTNKKWYKDRAIPYKRGYLFKGLPGNGKTSLALSIAKKFRKKIITVNLTTITDEGLLYCFKKLGSNSILLLEDIDAVFKEKRELKNVKAITAEAKEGLNFSTLLNCLDGVFSKEGTIVIMTTNHPEVLDPALIRPGRIDIKIDISNPTIASIEEYLFLFYEKEVKLDISKETYTKNLSMVDIQDVCIRNKDSYSLALVEIVDRAEEIIDPIRKLLINEI